MTPNNTLVSLGVACVLGILSFVLTLYLIPIVARYVERRGIFGKDINKRGTPVRERERCVDEAAAAAAAAAMIVSACLLLAPQAGDKPVPESLGLAVGVVFLVHVILFQQFVFFQDGDREWMVEYNAALATVCAGPVKAR